MASEDDKIQIILDQTLVPDRDTARRILRQRKGNLSKTLKHITHKEIVDATMVHNDRLSEQKASATEKEDKRSMVDRIAISDEDYVMVDSEYDELRDIISVLEGYPVEISSGTKKEKPSIFSMFGFAGLLRRQDENTEGTELKPMRKKGGKSYRKPKSKNRRKKSTVKKRK